MADSFASDEGFSHVRTHRAYLRGVNATMIISLSHPRHDAVKLVHLEPNLESGLFGPQNGLSDDE